MIKPAPIMRITTAVILTATLCGCQTISVPKIDIMKSPEFAEEAANFAKEKDFPSVQDAPQEPTDIRSAEQWDKDVRSLQALRDGDGEVQMESGPTDRQATAEFNRLKAKAQAYKKDDPKSGPVQGFPDYMPRR